MIKVYWFRESAFRLLSTNDPKPSGGEYYSNDIKGLLKLEERMNEEIDWLIRKRDAIIKERERLTPEDINEE
jgi:hypothetical protein